MKKYLIIILTLLTIVNNSFAQSETTRVDMTKVKELINEYMYNNLGDYESYSPISFTDPEDLISPIEKDTTYSRMLLDAYQSEKSTLRLVNEFVGHYIGRSDPYKDIETLIKTGTELMRSDYIETDAVKITIQGTKGIISKRKELQRYADNYKKNGPVIGIKITHKYRAKNKFGGTEIFEYMFGFDSNLTKIIQVEQKNSNNL